jgi:hypothetical protein
LVVELPFLLVPELLDTLDALEAVEVEVVVTDATVEVVAEATEAEVAAEADAELKSPPLIVNWML